MAAIGEKDALVLFWRDRLVDLLQQRHALEEDEREYVVTKISTMKDERLKLLIATLIGWGDDELHDMQNFCAIALELMKQARPSALREAAHRVELRFLAKKLQQTATPPIGKTL